MAPSTCFICRGALSPLEFTINEDDLDLDKLFSISNRKNDYRNIALEQTVFVLRILFGVPERMFLDKNAAPIVNDEDGSVQKFELCHHCDQAVDKAKGIYKGLLEAAQCFRRIQMVLVQKLKMRIVTEDTDNSMRQECSNNGPLGVQGKWREFINDCDYTCDSSIPFTIEDFTCIVENLAKSYVESDSAAASKIKVEELESPFETLDTAFYEHVKEDENELVGEGEKIIGSPVSDIQVKNEAEWEISSDDMSNQLVGPCSEVEEEEEEPEWKPDENDSLRSSNEDETSSSNDGDDDDRPSSIKSNNQSSNKKDTRTGATNRSKSKSSSQNSSSNFDSSKQNKQNAFQCTVDGCSKSFCRMGSLKTHITVTHNNTSKFKCEQCCEIFHTKQDLSSHCLKLHPHSCHLCEKQYPLERNLKIHLNSFHHLGLPRKEPKNIFTCTEEGCFKVYKTREALSVHTSKHKGVPCYKCTKCDAAFWNRHQLTRHEDMMHKEGFSGWVCEICGKTYACLEYLQQHRRGRHVEIKEKNSVEICELCGKEFDTKTKLYVHKYNAHNKKYTVLCEVCNQVFANETLLKNHLHRKHNIGTEADLGSNSVGGSKYKYIQKEPTCRCSVVGCRRSFYGEDAELNLKKHTISKHGPDGKGMPFQCKECGKGLGTRHRFDQHMMTHTNKDTKPFKCETCGNGFTNRGNLRYHQLNTHKAPRLFERRKETKPRSFIKNKKEKLKE